MSQLSRINVRTPFGIRQSFEVMCESSAQAVEQHMGLAGEGERIEALPVRDPQAAIDAMVTLEGEE